MAVVYPSTAEIKRIFFATGSRPHHVHASASGELVAVGLYGTDRVAVIETENDTLLGEWDSDPSTINGRVHAGVFSQDGETLYLLNDATNKLIAMEPRTGIVLWSMEIPGAHELVIAHNGKTAFVSRRPLNAVALVDLENHTYNDALPINLPDTLRLSANEKLLTVGLRTSPAQLAVVDTETFAVQLVNLAPPNTGTTTGGHQWTTPNGRSDLCLVRRHAQRGAGRDQSSSRQPGRAATVVSRRATRSHARPAVLITPRGFAPRSNAGALLSPPC